MVFCPSFQAADKTVHSICFRSRPSCENKRIFVVELRARRKGWPCLRFPLPTWSAGSTNRAGLPVTFSRTSDIHPCEV